MILIIMNLHGEGTSVIVGLCVLNHQTMGTLGGIIFTVITIAVLFKNILIYFNKDLWMVKIPEHHGKI